MEYNILQKELKNSILVNGKAVHSLPYLEMEGEQGQEILVSPLQYLHTESLYEIMLSQSKHFPSLNFAQQAGEQEYSDAVKIESAGLWDTTNSLDLPAQYHSTLKVKVSGCDAINLVNQLPDKTKLRIDPHTPLNLQQMSLWCEQVDISKVDFFEEPFLTWEEHVSFKNKYPLVPLALDQKLEQWIERPGVLDHFDAFILKPATFKNQKSLLQLLQKLQDNKKRIIISSAYSFKQNLYYEIQLAAEWAPRECHGFGTVFSFKHWDPLLEWNAPYLHFKGIQN